MFISEDRKRQMKNLIFNVKFVSLDKKTEEQISRCPPWTKVIELKSRIAKKHSVNNNLIRLFYNNTEMINSLSVLDYQLVDTKENIIHFRIDDHKLHEQGYIQVYGSFPSDKKLEKIIEEIKLGFLTGLHPTQNQDGTSGTYFMKSVTKEVVAVFKPIDEEAFAPNNQKGYPGKFGQQSFRKGILSGEGSIREVAASILDVNNKKIFRIPETTFVELSHKAFVRNSLNMMMSVESDSINKIKTSIIHNYIMENVVPDIGTGKYFSSNNLINHVNGNTKENLVTSKPLSIKTENSENTCIHDNFKTIETTTMRKKYGSLQKFVHNTEVAVNFCSDLFSVEEVHKIGILDLRILNCDRNDENILVIK